jgi:hypothetical protein
MKNKQKFDQNGREDEKLQSDYITDTTASKTPIDVDDSPKPMVVTGGHEAINQFFEWPIVRSDGAYQPLQYKTVGHLLSSGIDPGNIQAASLIHTIMLSAQWGYPISAMIVSDEPRLAVHFLDQCLKLAPKDATIEFRGLRPDHLYINGGKLLNGKCIISTESAGFSKVSTDLELIMTRGHAVRQELEKGKYGVGLSEYRSNMLVSVIGVDGGSPEKGICHPSVLKIAISPKRAATAQVDPKMIETYGLSQSPLFKIRKSFQRLKPRPVVIPFEEQLAKAITDSGCDDVQEKMGILKNMISVCAIINQPPPVQMAELGALIYGTDEQEVGRWLIDAGIEKTSEPSVDAPIVATKIDYYLARILLDGFLMTGQTYITDRQKKVFETVKAINLGKISTSMLGKADSVEILASITKNSGYWADREKIYQLINKDGNYPFSTVSKDLVDLLGKGLLERAKPPKSRHFGYHIVTMALNGAIQLPTPVTIQDPVYEGKSVSVVNPLTGQVEKI